MLANVANELAARPGIPALLPPSVLVIGYGNDLRSDDGAGIRVATRLARLASCRPQTASWHVIVARQLTPDLADGMATAAQVIFVDAYAADERGAGIRIDRISADNADNADTARTPSAIGHHGDPEALLCLTARLYGKTPDAWVVGIPAFNLDIGETISPGTLRGIDEAVALIDARAVPEAWKGDST